MYEVYAEFNPQPLSPQKSGLIYCQIPWEFQSCTNHSLCLQGIYSYAEGKPTITIKIEQNVTNSSNSVHPEEFRGRREW